MSKEHTYTNGEVTIVWKKELCVHSTKCWRGLSSVFKPGQRPWINAEGATTDAIKAQIDLCPSGALSYRLPNDVAPDPEAEPESLRIEASPNGPLLVKGACTIVHYDGREEKREKITALCRCGASANKPFCDGSHRQTGFSDGPKP
ncbi:MAG: (4Fe-4S)-binding protein [Flavobacteriales bacterium]|nr:(4Fe-4S)-binding protein [Flavobacteriales bacterium]